MLTWAKPDAGNKVLNFFSQIAQTLASGENKRNLRKLELPLHQLAVCVCLGSNISLGVVVQSK